MDRYDPDKAPDPEVWLALDEKQRIDLAVAFHRPEQFRLPNLKDHAALHATVENQIAACHASVVRAMAQLEAQGLSRHERIHAVAWEAFAGVQAEAKPAVAAAQLTDATRSPLAKVQAEERLPKDSADEETAGAGQEAELMRAQEQSLRLAREAKSLAVKHAVEQATACAELQRKAAQIALRKARDLLALTRIEREKLALEQEALDAIQARLSAEEAARAEGEATLAAEKQLLEELAQQAQAQRKAAELAALKARERIDAAALEQERALALEMAERIERHGEQAMDWCRRASAILAEAPATVFVRKTKPRVKFGSWAATALVAAVTLGIGWSAGTRSGASLKQDSPAQQAGASVDTGADFSAEAGEAKLQLSYALGSLQPLAADPVMPSAMTSAGVNR